MQCHGPIAESCKTESFLSTRKKKSSKIGDRQISGLCYQESCSCPVVEDHDRALFPVALEKTKSLDVFRDNLDIISIEEKVYRIAIAFDASTHPLFPLENGSMKVVQRRNYSVRSIINPPPTFIANFSIDINGNSGAGPINISTTNDLLLEISVNMNGRSSIYSIIRPISLEISPQGVTLGDGPMKIYIRVYYQIPPIPLVFHTNIPANTLLSPTVLVRLSGNILYNSLFNTLVASYNNDLEATFEGYTQPSHIEVTSN